MKDSRKPVLVYRIECFFEIERNEIRIDFAIRCIPPQVSKEVCYRKNLFARFCIMIFVRKVCHERFQSVSEAFGGNF